MGDRFRPLGPSCADRFRPLGGSGGPSWDAFVFRMHRSIFPTIGNCTMKDSGGSAFEMLLTDVGQTIVQTLLQTTCFSFPLCAVWNTQESHKQSKRAQFVVFCYCFLLHVTFGCHCSTQVSRGLFTRMIRAYEFFALSINELLI